MTKVIKVDKQPTKKELGLLAIVAAMTDQEVILEVDGQEIKVKAKQQDTEGRDLLRE